MTTVGKLRVALVQLFGVRQQWMAVQSVLVNGDGDGQTRQAVAQSSFNRSGLETTFDGGGIAAQCW